MMSKQGLIQHVGNLFQLSVPRIALLAAKSWSVRGKLNWPVFASVVVPLGMARRDTATSFCSEVVLCIFPESTILHRALRERVERQRTEAAQLAVLQHVICHADWLQNSVRDNKLIGVLGVRSPDFSPCCWRVVCMTRWYFSTTRHDAIGTSQHSKQAIWYPSFSLCKNNQTELMTCKNKQSTEGEGETFVATHKQFSERVAGIVALSGVAIGC